MPDDRPRYMQKLDNMGDPERRKCAEDIVYMFNGQSCDNLMKIAGSLVETNQAFPDKFHILADKIKALKDTPEKAIEFAYEVWTNSLDYNVHAELDSTKREIEKDMEKLLPK